jgi:hypothetical protein
MSAMGCKRTTIKYLYVVKNILIQAKYCSIWQVKKAWFESPIRKERSAEDSAKHRPRGELISGANK